MALNEDEEEEEEEKKGSVGRSVTPVCGVSLHSITYVIMKMSSCTYGRWVLSKSNHHFRLFPYIQV